MGRACRTTMPVKKNKHEVSWAEFLVYRADFACFDQDHNGVLDKLEVEQLLDRQLEGGAPTQAQVEQFLNEANMDGTRTVTLSEYIKAIVGGAWKIAGEDGEGWLLDAILAQA